MQFFEVDKSEIGAIFHQSTAYATHPHKFTTHAKVGEGYITLSHHRLADLIAAFKLLNPDVETHADFDTTQRYLFLLHAGKRNPDSMPCPVDDNNLQDQLQRLLVVRGRKRGTFEIEDVYGNIETLTITV